MPKVSNVDPLPSPPFVCPFSAALPSGENMSRKRKSPANEVMDLVSLTLLSSGSSNIKQRLNGRRES